MSKKKKTNEKPKALTNRHSQNPDVPLNKAIENLKSEIIDEVIKLGSGQVRSIYDLCQKGKELKELQSGEWGDLKKATKTQAAPSSGVTVDQF